jgi:hypothetical protein
MLGAGQGMTLEARCCDFSLEEAVRLVGFHLAAAAAASIQLVQARGDVVVNLDCCHALASGSHRDVARSLRHHSYQVLAHIHLVGPLAH